MLHLLAKWNHSVSKENSPSRKCRQKDLREFFVHSKWEKAHKEAYTGHSTQSSGIVIFGHLSVDDNSRTSGYKWAKISSVLWGKFSQCHRCAFLKHTIIIIVTGSLYLLIPFTYFTHLPTYLLLATHPLTLWQPPVCSLWLRVCFFGLSLFYFVYLFCS